MCKVYKHWRCIDNHCGDDVANINNDWELRLFHSFPKTHNCPQLIVYTPLHVIEFEYHPLSILHCNTLFYRCCLPRLILCPRASEPELCGQCNALACLERSEQCPPLIARYFISGGGPSERDAVSCSPSPLSPAAAAVTTTRTVLCIHWAGKEEMGTALHCWCWEFSFWAPCPRFC